MKGRYEQISTLLDQLVAMNMNQQIHEVTKQARDTGGSYIMPDDPKRLGPVDISLHGITVTGDDQEIAVQKWKNEAYRHLSLVDNERRAS